MEFLFFILVLLISVIAMAFWKDIKNMSARQPRRKKDEMKPVEKRSVEINKSLK